MRCTGVLVTSMAVASVAAAQVPADHARGRGPSGATLGGALWGVLIGTLADASRAKTTVVYRAPEGSRSTQVAVFPVITPRAKAIAASISF